MVKLRPQFIIFVLFVRFLEAYPHGHFRREVDDAQQNFGLRCFKTMASNQGNNNTCSNLLISPTSIISVLAMLLATAQGATLNELFSTMQLPDIDVMNTMRGFRGVRRSIERRIKSNDTEVFIGDRMFLDYDIGVRRQHTHRIGRFFGKTPTKIHFSRSKEAAHLINNEVADITKGQIRNIINSNSLNSLTKVVMISAIYLKAKWEHDFEPGRTTKSNFRTPNGKKAVSMMRTVDRFEHGHSSQIKSRLLFLPYKNSALNMVVILPDVLVSTDTVIDLLTKVKLSDLLSANYQFEKLEVHLPKFKLELTYDMKDVIRKMGFRSGFEANNANLGFISKEPLYVNSFKHSAAMTVDEEGTTASAVTDMAISSRSAFPWNGFIVDRAFILMLIDRHRGTLLFIGRVNDPTSTNSCGR